jgi:hypothetical protein
MFLTDSFAATRSSTTARCCYHISLADSIARRCCSAAVAQKPSQLREQTCKISNLLHLKHNIPTFVTGQEKQSTGYSNGLLTKKTVYASGDRSNLKKKCHFLFAYFERDIFKFLTRPTLLLKLVRDSKRAHFTNVTTHTYSKTETDDMFLYATCRS